MEKSIRLASLGGALILGMVVAPAPSYAQSDQKIVMRCTYDGYTDQTLDYVVDLGARTISLTHTTTGYIASVTHYSGRVTQVSDDQVVWVYSGSDRTITETLNRYTGQIVGQVASPTDGTFTVSQSCKRQEKQF